MTPIALRHLEKARHCLENSDIALASGLTEDSGRLVYLAAFHAAQAILVERHGKAPKTHHGVHTEFARTMKDDNSFPDLLRQFLSQSYAFKNVADYEVGPSATVAEDDVKAARSRAAEFPRLVAERLP